jgi:hypothetical protein
MLTTDQHGFRSTSMLTTGSNDSDGRQLANTVECLVDAASDHRLAS